MNSRPLFLAVMLLGISTVNSSAQAGSPTACLVRVIKSIFKIPSPETIQAITEINDDLLRYYPATFEHGQAVSEKTLSDLNHLALPETRDRLKGVRKKQAEEIYLKVANHPVAGMDALPGYDPDGHIGFCFGRAMLTHLYALKLGVHRDSIRKIWAIGSFYSVENFLPDLDLRHKWSYHVATIVRDRDGSWWAIDPVLSDEPIQAEVWASRMIALSTPDPRNHTLPSRYEILSTSAKRFAPGAGSTYSNLVQSQDPSREPYFTDLLRTFRAEIRSLR